MEQYDAEDCEGLTQGGPETREEDLLDSDEEEEGEEDEEEQEEQEEE